MSLAEPIAVTLEVTAALDKLGVRYLVGGSLATFNVLHLETMFKVDVFISDRSELLVEEMSRRELLELGEAGIG